MEAPSPEPTVHGGRGTAVTTLVLIAVTVAAMTALVLFAAPALNTSVEVAVACAIGAVHLGLALIVLRLAPGHVAAVLLAAMGLIVVLTNTVDNARVAPVFDGGWMLLYLPLALLLLVIPTGRPATRRWWSVGVALCAVVAAFIAACAAQSLSPTARELLDAPVLALLVLFLGLLIACAAAPFVRYRHADEQQRLRLRWVLAAGLSLPLTLMLCWTSYLVFGVPDLVVFGLLIMLLAIPAGAAIALTRPELFDIDRATVAVVTGMMLLALGLAALSAPSIAVGLPLAEWPAIPAAMTAGAVTLAAAAAYPFARRGMERILFPERGRAIEGLHELSRRVDAGTAAPEQVQQVLRAALRDPGLLVGYRRFADRVLVGLNGEPVPHADGGAIGIAGSASALSDTGSGLPASAAVVRARGEEIGAILPSPARQRRPSAAIVRAAAPLVDAVRSRSELASASAQLEASRERLLRTGYEERRRLERDLHDGAQQRLVALGMQLRVLQRSVVLRSAQDRSAPAGDLAADPGTDNGSDAQIAESLDAAVAQLGTAVAELRRLAHGVRPSALDDGLGAALAELERLAPETIELDVRAGELPDAVALTAYYVVSEAVANALRHAGASRILVVVRRTPDTLHVQVADDGRGGAVARSTGGLTGLADRVGALGGDLRLDSVAGAGTTVQAVLPCGS